MHLVYSVAGQYFIVLRQDILFNHSIIACNIFLIENATMYMIFHIFFFHRINYQEPNNWVKGVCSFYGFWCIFQIAI